MSDLQKYGRHLNASCGTVEYKADALDECTCGLAEAVARDAASSAREARLREALEAVGRIARTPPRTVADETVVGLVDAALADPPRPVERNQCDGCQAGRPVDENGNHRMGDGAYADLLHCQREKYAARPVEGPRSAESYAALEGDATPLAGNPKHFDAPAPRYTREEVERLRGLADALAQEFEATVRHAEWKAAGSRGMYVPFHGDFAAAAQLPSLVGRMRWWARELRAALTPNETTPPATPEDADIRPAACRDGIHWREDGPLAPCTNCGATPGRRKGRWEVRVQLSLVERTLNRMARAERKRSGDLMTRMQQEADVLREAFTEVRREAFEEAARVADAEAAEYQKSAKENDAAGYTHGGTLDTHGFLACRDVATLLRSLASTPGAP